MKMIVDRLQLLVAAAAVVAVVYMPQVLAQPKEEIVDACHQDAKNAVYGASQRMREAPYVFKWVTTDEVKKMIQDGASGAEALYVHFDGVPVPEHKKHVEGLITQGYALMEVWIAAYGKDKMPNPEKIYAQFNKECLARFTKPESGS